MTQKKTGGPVKPAVAMELAYLRGQSEAYREAMRQALYMYGMASLSGDGVTPEILRRASKHLVDVLLDKSAEANQAIATLGSLRKAVVTSGKRGKRAKR